MGHTSIRQLGLLITGTAAAKLRERARFLGAKPEELAGRILEDYLKTSADEVIEPTDERFQTAATLLLRRNSDLYWKLARRVS